MPRKNIHDLCQCGNKKQIRSKLCKPCNSKLQSEIYTKNRRLCPQCNGSLHKLATVCNTCLLENKKLSVLHNNTPIKNYLYKNNKDPNFFSRIRSHAASVVKHLQLSSNCSVCNFPHTDICHIKPIADFDENTPICEVNSRDNLIILCKNCHWLFDHGHNSLDAIQDYYTKLSASVNDITVPS